MPKYVIADLSDDKNPYVYGATYDLLSQAVAVSKLLQQDHPSFKVYELRQIPKDAIGYMSLEQAIAEEKELMLIKEKDLMAKKNKKI